MKTIRHQLLVGLLGGALACTVAAGLAMYVKVSEEANELFDHQLRQLAASLPAQVTQQADAETHDESEEDIVIQAWDQRGTLLYASPAAQLLPRVARTGYTSITAHNERWRVYGEERHERFVQVAQATSARHELAAALALRSLLPFLLLVPVLAALIYIVVGHSLRPLGRVAEALGQRSPNALQPLPLDGHPPEVLPMVTALNELLRQLERALASQRAFVADAAHELRSPLTALKLQLQLAERARSDEQREAAFAKLHDRLDRSTHLVHQLLTSARQEPPAAGRTTALVDLPGLARLCVADHYAQACARGIDLGVEQTGAPAAVTGNADELQILLGNLIENALRYTPSGGQVDVAVAVENGRPLVRVTDTGPGIPVAERERVFDRFYRGEGNDAWGSGLGLSIVRSIAEAHGAEVALGDNPDGHGLCVTVGWVRLCHAHA
jgi:two-component system OmpR family sensor kinase